MRSLAIVALLALTQVACALLSGAQGREATLPAVTSEPAQPATATSAPAQPTAPASPTAAPATPTAEPPAATEAPAPTTAARPQVTLPAAQPGPETLDLDNSPDLFKHPLVEYTARVQDDSRGEDPNGQPSLITLRFQARFQTYPAEAWNSVEALFAEDATVETVQLDGKQFVISDGNCTEAEPGASPQSPFGALDGAFIGTVKRVAQGVEINGLLADQYTLEKENLKPDHPVKFITENGGEGSENSATMSVTLTGSGSLYVAQQGGFAIKLELSDSAKATDEMPFFKPGSDLARATLFEVIPTGPESEPIALPETCAALAGAGDGGDPASGTVPEGPLDLPQPENSTVITDSGDYQVLQAPGPIETVEAFYKTELAAQGFNLQSADKIGPIVELHFEKDGATVEITIIASGDSVMITIAQS